MASTLEAFVCVGCGHSVPPATATRCPACEGSLYGQYDWPVAEGHASFPDREGIRAYDALLPFGVDDTSGPVTLGEGGAPLIECPALAETAGVEALTVEDDGRSTWRLLGLFALGTVSLVATTAAVWGQFGGWTVGVPFFLGGASVMVGWCLLGVLRR